MKKHRPPSMAGGFVAVLFLALATNKSGRSLKSQNHRMTVLFTLRRQ
jgi:hypothetical protein